MRACGREGNNSKPEYNGPCCGGTRKVGDFGRYLCQPGNVYLYCCGKCRTPLALTDDQRERMAKNKDAALDRLMLKDLEKAEDAYLEAKRAGDMESLPVWVRE